MAPNRPSSSTAHPANDDDDDFTNIISAPSRSELTAMLKKLSIGGTIKQKCDYIKRAILIHRHAIQRIITSHLPQMEYDHFLVIPKRATAEHLAAMYFDIHTAFGMLKGVCGAEGGRVTRQDAKFVEDTIIPAYDHIEDATRKATSEINESKADAARSSMVKLTDAERNRRFLEGGATLPADPAMRYCPYCKCKGTVDIPVENEEKRTRNMRRLQEYSQ